MRITPAEYEAIDLFAHRFLADIPLHDVWRVDLAGGAPGLTIQNLRTHLTMESFAETNAVVRFLFQLRGWLGSAFGLDRERPRAQRESFLDRLTDAEREASLVPPGTPEGPFQLLFVSETESISEIRNATVHAFSVFALVDGSSGYRFYWAIYVRPLGWITPCYMALIDPFRRFIIYPAILRHVRSVFANIVAAREG